MPNTIFVLSGGIGNIVQATPAIKVLLEEGHVVDLALFCNSSKDLEIFRLPGIRQLYISATNKEKYDYQLTGPFTPNIKFNATKIIRTRVNYAQHLPEVFVYMDLLKQIGIKKEPGNISINIGNSGPTPDKDTIMIFPGSKPNWSMKRWNDYDRLADLFSSVTVVGKKEDIESHGNPAWIKRPWKWGKHVKFLSCKLQEAAYYISKCKAFIGNDSGLSHISAATRIPTFVIFGPSSDIKNKPYANNAHVIALDIPCRPCQFKAGSDGKQIFADGKNDCPLHMKCMKELTVEQVYNKIKGIIWS